MPSLKDVKTKIAGIGKTQQITKAMNMVSSAKLRGAQTRIDHFRPFSSTYRDVLTDLAGRVKGVSHPLLDVHVEKKVCAIVVVTSDRGLCGGFNAAIIDRAAKLAQDRIAKGMQVKMLCVGRKGRDFFARMQGVELFREYVDRMGSLDFTLASAVARPLLRLYSACEFDEVHLAYGEFVSMAHQPPRMVQLLPFEPPVPAEGEEKKAEGPQCDYLYEPNEDRLLGDILPQYIRVQIYSAMLDTSASEHAARMAAMDNATRNCKDLISSLTLLYNKTRQASITNELIDIVGGAEAQNG